MKNEIKKWTFPLHFIDFETSMVAIPFNKGRRPYEAIAFQFSHHTVDKEGKVAHAGEYLCTTRGMFPNYEFTRRLKAELENDKGTIFRYGSHENTYLNKIHEQLLKALLKYCELDTLAMVMIYEGWREMISPWVPRRICADS